MSAFWRVKSARKRAQSVRDSPFLRVQTTRDSFLRRMREENRSIARRVPPPRERALPRKTRETGRRRTIVKIYDDTKGFEIAVPSVRFRVRGRSLFFCRFRRRFFYAYSRVLLLFRVLLRVLLRVGFGDRSFVGRAVFARNAARFEFSVF